MNPRSSRTRLLIPHSYLFFSLRLVHAFPFAGAVDEIMLPEDMQSVDFSYCSNLTGTADLEDE
jgi:hypothetical protein